MEKVWKKVLNSVWKSDRELTIKEIVDDTDLEIRQVRNAVYNMLSGMHLIDITKKWENKGIPRSKVIISIKKSQRDKVKGILENGGY